MDQDKNRTSTAAWLRKSWLVRKRDGYSCQHCGRQFEKGKGGLDVHHVIPWRLGGSDDFDNLISLCKSCHKRADQAIRAAEREQGITRPAYIRSAPLPNHCARGHEFNAQNSRPRKDGGRRCLICQRVSDAKRREKTRNSLEAKQKRREWERAYYWANIETRRTYAREWWRARGRLVLLCL